MRFQGCLTLALGLSWASFALSTPPSPTIEPAAYAADIFFGTYSATLPADAQSRLDRPLQQGHKMSGHACVVVVGHSDVLEAGVTDAQTLSLNRAKAVAAVFQADGYSADRIFVEAKGATQPIAGGSNPINSRVEVEVYPC